MIPVVSTCAEKCFSKLKIITNYLRDKINQERLFDLSMVFIEKSSSGKIDYDKIVNELAAVKLRKKYFEISSNIIF